MPEPIDQVLRGQINKLPRVPTQTVKLYLSCTIEDFEYERQCIWHNIMPELQHRFVECGLGIQLIDLHHASDIDHSHDTHRLSKHLKEIENCSNSLCGPFFLCLLGNRRGPVPLPESIPYDEFILICKFLEEHKHSGDSALLKEWYILDENNIPKVFMLKEITEVFPEFNFNDGDTRKERIADVTGWLEVFRKLSRSLNVAVSRMTPATATPASLASLATPTASTHALNVSPEQRTALEWLKGRQLPYQHYTMSGVEQEIATALRISNKDVLFAFRHFNEIEITDEAAARYTDLRGHTRDLDNNARVVNLRQHILEVIDQSNRCEFTVDWQKEGLAPDTCKQHADYVQSFCSTIVEKLSLMIEQRQENKLLIAIRSPLKRHVFSEALVHSIHCSQLVTKNAYQDDHTITRIKSLLTNGEDQEHQAILVYGPPGSGKASTLANICYAALDMFGSQDTILITRFVGLTPQSQTLKDIVSSICTQIDFIMNQQIDLVQDDLERLFGYYYSLLNRMAKTGKHLVIVLDGIDRLKGNKSNKPGDVQINWLAAKLQAKVHIVLSFSTNDQNSELTQQFLGKFVFAESLVQVSPMTDEELKNTIRTQLALENRQITDYQERCVRSALRGKARPLLVSCMCEDALKWNSQFVISYTGDSSNLMVSSEQAVTRRLAALEKQYTPELIGYIARYLSSACTSLSEMELLDLLSCNKEAMVAAGSKQWRGPVCRFPFSLWLRIRIDLGVLLEERFIDCKSLLCWSNHLIWQTTVARYFVQVDQIKQTHKDIAELFLLTTSMGGVEQSENRTACSEWRPICPQPLLYSETKYNLRRLSELWFQLLHAGEIEHFKEHCFCHFDYLLAKMHSSSVTSLICALEKTLSHVLDAELHIILRCIVQAKQILLRDPLQLASELIGRLRQVKEQYPSHIDNLVLQCMEWCDAHSLPLLVPLSSWLPDPRTPLVTTLHCNDEIGKLAVTRNGQHLFCTTSRNEIAMYHVPSKKLIRSFSGHESALTSVCLTRSNRYVISGGTDCCIKIYEINTGQLIRTLKHHTDSVLCLLVTKSDEYIVSGSQDCQFAICSLDTGEVKNMYKEHTAGITCLCLNQKNTVLVTASSDKTIKSWTFDDLVLLNIIDYGIESPIGTLALSVDNTFLVIGLFDNSLIVKSFTTGSDVHKLEGHKGRVTDVLISKDCHHCVVACTDGCMYTYNLRTTELLDMSSCRNAVTSVCLSKDENFIFSAAKDTVKVWTFYRRQTRLNHSDDHTDHVTCISISEDGKTAITGSKDATVKLWNLDISDFMENLVGHTDIITCVALDKEDQFAASGSADTSVKIWSIMMGCVITNFKEHKSSVNGLIVVQHGRVLSSETSGVIKLWKAENGESLITLFGPVTLLGVSPNAELALSGVGNQSLKLWSMATGDIYQTINHADKITTAVFSKDSQYLVTGSVDQSLKIWEAINGRLAQVLVEHSDTVSCVAITASNRHVVSGSHDKTLLVWGLAAGAVEHRLDGHTDHVTCVKVTEDGTIALSGSRDGCIHMWNLVYGLPVTIFDMHLAVLSVEMTNDGGHVVVRLEHGCHVPLMCLHNTPAGEIKSQSQVEIQVIGGGPVLPIRKKALVVNRPATNMMLAKVNKTGTIFRSVSSIPEIVKAPLQKAVRAQEQNKQSRLQRLMTRKKGKEEKNSSSKEKSKQEKKSGICNIV